MPDESSENVLIEKKINKIKEEKIQDSGVFDKELPSAASIKNEEDTLKKEASPESRSLLKGDINGQVLQVAGVSGPEKDIMDINMEKKGFKWIVPSTGVLKSVQRKVFEGGEYGGADGGPAGGAGGTGGGAAGSGAGGGGRVGNYEDITPYLLVKVYRYVESETGEKFFKVVVSIKKKYLPVPIPKEVVFLLDSSKSITNEKLNYIKPALIDALWELNRYDKFNVVAFRGNLIKFSERSVTTTTKNLLAAEVFIRKLEAVEETDVDKALADVINTPMGMSPSYIVLLSDGRPTKGVVDSRKIIKELTRANNMRKPIFCFSGGDRVNRYLLDFIAYQNRGWSQFADRVTRMKEEFMVFTKQVKEPLLLNVRYHLVNIPEEEVYPKYLPDFFYGRDLVIYGRFKDEDQFSMQLLGEISGRTKELIFKKSLIKAEIGGPDIKKEWAFSKIYHLISQETLGIGDRLSTISEIKELSRKYGIITPYDLRDEK
ncbi:MAG: VWA domain-containing protein [Candidatus Omnitrophica bacterium]|nr:VWA domain-containing protein [Candidatus Omnitrophota bacterium]